MNQMLKLSENFKADVMKMFQWSIQHSLEKNKEVENLSKEIDIKKKNQVKIMETKILH